MSPKGFIFDFDGVVADSLSAHLQAWQRAYRQIFEMELLAPDRLVGYSTAEIGAMLANERGQPQRYTEIVSAKIAFLQSAADGIGLYPEVSDIFSRLSFLKKPFGICSNASSAYIKSVLNRHRVHCPIIIGSKEAGRPKPAADGYLRCVQHLGIAQEDYADVICFEDSLHGLRAIVDAGLFPIGIATQHDSRVLLEHGARVAFPRLVDALASGLFC